jgi:dCMP deaminase
MVFDQALSTERWDAFYMELAALVASKSKDRSIKVGAVAVGEGHTMVSMGYNGFVRYCDDEVEERHIRPEKYNWTAHAELNVICNAARNGQSLLNAVMYTTSHPCVECSIAIAQAGFSEVIVPPKEDDPFWQSKSGGEEVIKKSREVLKEARVRVIEYVV